MNLGYFPLAPLLWNCKKYPCLYIFPLEFGGAVNYCADDDDDGGNGGDDNDGGDDDDDDQFTTTTMTSLYDVT